MITMKKILHNSLIRTFSVWLSLFMVNNLQAQTNPEDLWGTWDLETVEITKSGVTETHSLTGLLADKENLPRNMFTLLYFFNNQIGVNNTESEFVSGENLNLKGAFTANDGILTITINNEQPRTFSYIIENDLLKIWYTQDDETQLYLVYKLFKMPE